MAKRKEIATLTAVQIIAVRAGDGTDGLVMIDSKGVVYTWVGGWRRMSMEEATDVPQN